jgi:predicted enzyme related to lactoylglutathione lyase
MELGEVILYVEDMATQVAFYRDKLGLKIKNLRASAEPRGETWIEFATGGCSLCLHGGGGRRLGEDAPKIVFRVADVAAARAALVARGVAMGRIRSPAVGVGVADGRDPEGNAFSVESRG